MRKTLVLMGLFLSFMLLVSGCDLFNPKSETKPPKQLTVKKAKADVGAGSQLDGLLSSEDRC